MKKESIKRGVIISVILLLVLFIIRFVYSITYKPNTEIAPVYGYQNINQPVQIQNFASRKVKYNKENTGTGTYVVDQKYEKTAQLKSTTTEFEKDNEKLIKAIENAKAIIQYENRTGLTGNQNVYMSIGIHPSLFDTFVEELKNIGTLNSISVNKIDKTSEYKNLSADKISLEKARDALISLKGRSGEIGDLIELQNRIL